MIDVCPDSSLGKISMLILFNGFLLLCLISLLYLSIFAGAGYTSVLSASSSAIDTPLGGIGIAFLILILNEGIYFLQVLIMISFLGGNGLILRSEIEEMCIDFRRFWRRFNHQKEYRSREDL